jgi:CRP-like cAMP-binding protein
VKNNLDRGNKLLGKLPERDNQLLSPGLEEIKLNFGDVLYEVNAPIDHTYFVTQGTLSAVVVMEDGKMIEVATIGNEGAVGLPGASEVNLSANRVFAQIPGKALRIETAALREVVAESPTLAKLIGRYHAAFLYQASRSVACNGLHTVQQRCARWLLMTHDRVMTDEFMLTHEILAVMLGVRRATVTDVLQPLQQQGIVGGGRGKITIVNRARLEKISCECYRAVTAEYEKLLA